MATHGIWEVYLLRDCRLFQQLVSQARPNQPQRGLLSVSRTGKEVTLKAIRAGVGCVWLARLFNYKHSNGGTGGGCTVVLVVLPLVSLDSDNGSHRRVNTAATQQAVYLVWLFLRITTTCNLSIIGLVRKGFPESLAHAQTVDTRPLSSPPTWPGYEARLAQAHPNEEDGYL